MKGSLIACEEPVKRHARERRHAHGLGAGANPSTNGANYSFNTGNEIISTLSDNLATVLEEGTFYTASEPHGRVSAKPVTITPVTRRQGDGKLGAVRQR